MHKITKIATYERVQSLISHLKQAEDFLYSNPNMSLEQLTPHISTEAVDLLHDFIDHHKISVSDRDSLHQALTGLIVSLQSTEKITVTTAVDLSNDFISRLHAWFQKNLGVTVAIENCVDRKILGGLIIWWRGAYIDLSLSPKVTNT